MSRDIFVQEIPNAVKCLDDLPKDYNPPIIGQRSSLIAKICEVVPNADFSNPEWGTLDASNYWIEFSMGNEEQVTCIGLQVRGSEAAVPVIAKMLDHLGLRAFDPSSPTGIFGEQSPDGYHKWKEYRDYVAGE